MLLLLEDIVDTVYIKHDLFHQSKPGWGVELQNLLNVLFKSVRLVHNWDSDQSWLIGIETQH